MATGAAAAAPATPAPSPSVTPPVSNPAPTKKPASKTPPQTPPAPLTAAKRAMIPNTTKPPATTDQLKRALGSGTRIGPEEDGVYHLFTRDKTSDVAAKLRKRSWDVVKTDWRAGMVVAFPMQQVAKPDVTYHLVPKTALNQVLSQGLLPGSTGRSTKNISSEHGIGKTFVTADHEALAGWQKQFGGNLVRLKVDMAKVSAPTWKDGASPLDKHSLYLLDTHIPPEALSVLPSEAGVATPGAEKASASKVAAPEQMSDEDLKQEHERYRTATNKGTPLSAADRERAGHVQVEFVKRDMAQRASQRKTQTAKRKTARAETSNARAAQIKEMQEKGTMPDGRQMAKHGDAVSMTQGGFSGLPTVIHGVVEQTKNGDLKVRTTGGSDAIGLAHVSKGKLVDWTPRWTVKGDPELTRRKTATAEQEKAQQEKNVSGAAAAKAWKKQHGIPEHPDNSSIPAPGHELKAGDVLEDRDGRRVTVAHIDDDGSPLAKDSPEDSEYTLGHIGDWRKVSEGKAATKAAASGKFGSAGEKHPITGATDAEQRTQLAKINGDLMNQSTQGNIDPLGVHTGPPPDWT